MYVFRLNTGGETSRVWRYTPPSAFLFLGVAIVLSAGAIGKSEQQSWRDFLPTFVATLVLCCAVGVWQYALWSEAHDVHDETSSQGEAIRAQLLQGFDDRVQSIERMAGRLQFSVAPSKPAWEADANLYVKHLGIIEAFAVMDAHYRVKWVYPYEENKRFINLDISVDPVRKQTIDASRDMHVPKLSPVMNLKQGGRGFVLYVSLFRESQFIGTLGSEYETRSLSQETDSDTRVRHSNSVERRITLFDLKRRT